MNATTASFGPYAYNFAPCTPKPWSEFCAQIRGLYKPPLRAKKTYLGMDLAIRLLTGLGIETTADLTPDLIGRLVASRPENLSPNTVRGNLRYVQALCTFAEQTGALSGPSPFRIRPIGSWKRAAKPKRKQHASREEIRRVLDFMSEQAKQDGWKGWKAKRLHGLTALLAYTGLRGGEAQFLQVQDVDLERGIIHVVSRASHRLKTAASEAVVPIPPALKPILEEWLKHRMSAPAGFKLKDPSCPWLWPTTRRHNNTPWANGGPGDRPASRMKIVAAQVGVASFTPLTLRHSLGTHMLHFGAGKAMIQRLLRHSNQATQSFYTHDDDQNLRDAVQNVDF